MSRSRAPSSAASDKQAGRGPSERMADARAAYRAQKISTVIGLVAAMLIAVLVNILSARHYFRWDWTSSRRYTLSFKTGQILASMSAPIDVFVLLSTADPLSLTVRHLLQAYQAKSSLLKVQFVEPDRNPARLKALEQRYDIRAGRSRDGQLVADAAIIVARGDRHQFITEAELVDVEDQEGLTVRPRLEQALTSAIVRVLQREQPQLCFTSGHGEASVDDFTQRGLGSLERRLVKTNYQVVVLPPVTALSGPDPINRCRLVIVAGPQQRLSAQEDARLRAYLQRGGNALLALGPVLDSVARRFVDPGLESVLQLVNVVRRDDVVFERSPDRRTDVGFGEGLFAEAKAHAITEAMVETPERDFGVYLEMASSLTTSPNGELVPTALLVTSAEAFGMVDFFAWASDPVAPQPTAADHRGPLVLAYAAQIPRQNADPKKEGDAGGRVVIIGSDSVLASANWHLEQLRATALFVENAISWLAAEPIDLQLPKQPAQSLGIRISAEGLSSAARYALLYVPLATVLLGLAVAIRRRGVKRSS